MQKMNIIARNVTVTMCRDTLAGIPAHALPLGYRIRSYAPGDEHEWVRIESAADQFNAISVELFRTEFGDNPARLAERQLYLLDGPGTIIGTATAWFDNAHRGQPYGRIHWVAIHPDFQGQGLSKPLLTSACRRLYELGHGKAYLVTSSARINAINLYAQFGFRTEIQGAQDEAVWEELRGHLRNFPGQSPQG